MDIHPPFVARVNAEAARMLWKRGGHVAVTELCWVRADPPEECAAFFASEYPAMCGVEPRLAAIERAGYGNIGHFVLPRAAWWDPFYAPLERAIPEFETRHAGDQDALAVARAAVREIEIFRRHGGWYGYVFFVMRG